MFQHLKEDGSTAVCTHQIKWVFKGTMIFLFLALSVFVIFKTRNAVREYGYIGRAPLSQYTITINGEGKVSGVPDVAIINLGVTSEAKTVKAAQSDNTKKMNDIIKAVKDLGVEAKDVQTANYSIYPKYSYDNVRGTSNIVGYTVSQSVTVKIRDLDKIGDALAAAGNLGANQVGGVQFTIDKPESLQADARQEAIKDAKNKANALAKELGVSLGRVVSFNEYIDSGVYPYRAYAETLGIGGGSPAPDIEPGSQELQVSVNVVFEIK